MKVSWMLGCRAFAGLGQKTVASAFHRVPSWTALPMSCRFRFAALGSMVIETIERLQFLGSESRA